MDDDIRHVPACAVFDGAETEGAWGDVLRAAGQLPADAHASGRVTREQRSEREAPRLRSAAVFGSRFFAEVVLAVDRLSRAGDVGVTVRMAAADTGLVDSVVRPVMRRLCDGGLLAEGTRSGRGALRYQVRRGSLWDGVLSACMALG